MNEWQEFIFDRIADYRTHRGEIDSEGFQWPTEVACYVATAHAVRMQAAGEKCPRMVVCDGIGGLCFESSNLGFTSVQITKTGECRSNVFSQ